MTTIIDLIKDKLIQNSSKRIFLTRFIIALVYCLLSFIMVTKGGFYVLTLLNDKVGNPMLHIGFLQVIVVPWVYGTRNLIRDIEKMVGPKPKIFWIFFAICWMLICPLILAVSFSWNRFFVFNF